MRRLLCLLTLLVLPMTADAAVMNSDGTHPHTFTDDATGFVWRDIGTTAGISFNNMVLEFGDGGSFAGYRHATLAEVQQLFDNLGALTTNWPGRTEVAGASAVDDYRDMLVITTSTFLVEGEGVLTERATGVTADVDESGRHIQGQLSVLQQDPGSFTGGSTDALLTIEAGFADPNSGHWLILESSTSEAVPEPSTIAVWSLLGLGLVVARRRWRKH